MTYKKTFGLTLFAAAATLPGCGEESPEPEPGDFVSDNPGGGGGYGGGDDAGDTGGGTDGGDEGGPSGDGERAIAEADIIQLEGDRLYALSAYGGLTIIDVSTPDVFPVLGHHRANARPFEMYVDNGQVFVMYTDYGSYEYDIDLGTYAWITSSKLVALDATNPASIQERGAFDMPGWIQDSRRVGDVLYLVTYEDGWCWSCDESPNTTVTSLNVADEANVQLVDQLSFEDEDEYGWGWGFGARSVSATNERLFVSGVEFSDTGDDRSTIDVIDISDPSGQMMRGASIEVAGTIESRWQMDEHEGVLRVISQPGFWGSQDPPVIETFAVESSMNVSPLGSTTMVLPRPESLRSVRFDGERGYAITFERTDPLFTIDLSDPAQPQQMGELEIPGWVYHMEPRGDRILGLGFDDGNPQGSLNLSLFDVSDFSNPTMLSRVHFGGDWGNFAEDQNRIHKAFTILDDLGLLLVPFSGWSHTDEEWSCGTYQSGIQLVDWTNDALATRGTAPSRGQARRAILHDDRLLGISDMAVESFDISNRDQPAKMGELALAANVSGVSMQGNTVTRLSIDWWTTSVLLETTTADRADEPEPLGRIDLSTIVDQDPNECGYYGLYNAQVVTHEGFAYLVRSEYDYETYSGGTTKIEVVDVRNPANPTFVKTVELPFMWDPYGGGYYYGDWYGYGFGYGYGEGGSLVLAGNALLMQTRRSEWDEFGENYVGETAQIEVVDLSVPGDPKAGRTLNRPAGLSHGGLTKVDDTTLVSWHMQAANADGTKVRFYLDRFDASDPSSPQARTPVNVPGAVVGYDAESQRAVTADFQVEIVSLDEDSCWMHPRSNGWDYEWNRCMLASRDLSIVQLMDSGAYVLDSTSVEGDDGSLRGIAAASGRLYAHVGNPFYGWGGIAEDGSVTMPASQDQLVVFEDWESGRFSEASRVKTGATSSWMGQLRPVGDKLLFNADNGLGELDTTDASAPQLRVHELYGYGCWNLTTTDSQAMCAMGEFGLQIIDL